MCLCGGRQILSLPQSPVNHEVNGISSMCHLPCLSAQRMTFAPLEWCRARGVRFLLARLTCSQRLAHVRAIRSTCKLFKVGQFNDLPRSTQRPSFVATINEGAPPPVGKRALTAGISIWLLRRCYVDRARFELAHNLVWPALPACVFGVVAVCFSAHLSYFSANGFY